MLAVFPYIVCLLILLYCCINHVIIILILVLKILTPKRHSLTILLLDIDECSIPELAGKCVENAECCNLPAEYVCKCKQGFEGDGQVECRGKL